MASTLSSGTQTATITTEHTLSTETAVGSLVLLVDTAAMTLGDMLELRVKTKILSGGTTRTVYTAYYQHVQSADDMIKVSVPIPTDQEAVFTLKQSAGTGRAFPWKVMSL